jgi:hypothetical protein
MYSRSRKPRKKAARVDLTALQAGEALAYCRVRRVSRESLAASLHQTKVAIDAQKAARNP